MKQRYYIGLGTTFHDPAIAIVDHGGQVVFAEATERHLQNKRALNCPPDEMLYLTDLVREHCSEAQEFVVATSWSNRFQRISKLAALFGKHRFNSIRRHGRATNFLLQPWFHLPLASSYMYQSQLAAGLGSLLSVNEVFRHLNVELRRYEHHLTHAAHACLTSPFEHAQCVVIDGFGEFGSMAVYQFTNGHFGRVKKQLGSASLGLFYGYVTELCGFSLIGGEEGKTMGLAPYGRHDAQLYDLLSRLLTVKKGQLQTPSRRDRREITSRLETLRCNINDDFDGAANIAFAGQQVFAETMNALLEWIARDATSENLVLSGGCALNSAYNGSILQQTRFKQLYVPAAPADDGNAIGAALLAWSQDNPESQYSPGRHSAAYPFLGSRMSENVVQRAFETTGTGKIRRPGNKLASEAAALLTRGKVIGWLQGRAEFGPRALGNRSILADPRSARSRDTINKRIKFREAFRPLAPVILDAYGEEFFEDYQSSPHMERVLQLRENKRDLVPAIVHVDGSCRLQSMNANTNPALHNLLTEFHALTGIPMLLNTSFNIMGKPMVHTVEDAIGMFHTSALDALVIDDVLIEK